MIKVTEKAAKEILRISKAHHLPKGIPLRLGIVQGGCGGLDHVIGFDLMPFSADDKCYECGGIQIVVDNESHVHLARTVVDFKESPIGRGFLFQNPNAKGWCACGLSFSITGEPAKGRRLRGGWTIEGIGKEFDGTIGITGRMRMIHERVKAVVEKPKVYFEGQIHGQTYGVNTGVHNAITIAGGVNILGLSRRSRIEIAGEQQAAHPVLPDEFIFEANPDVIILSRWSHTSADAVRKRPGWREIQAVKEGRVYQLTIENDGSPWFDSDIKRLHLARWHYGVSCVQSVERLAHWFHPDFFSDNSVWFFLHKESKSKGSVV